jgi:hypothetical protein
MRNTDVFTQLTQLIGKEFRSPRMSLLDAQKYMATWTPPDSVYRHLASGDVVA